MTSAFPLAPRTLFILVLLLFALWVGFLGVLAVKTADPIILSRPQILVSTLDVIAEVSETSGKASPRIQIQEVHWPKQAERLVGQEIEVANLPAASGWRGAGRYIVPLVQQDGVYLVASVPRSPGFVGLPPRIYPLTEATRAQLDEIKKPR
jgi:hypothetical protein